MSSTNKTNNYELSQYIGSDKPTYLGDYNADMQKIDLAIHNLNEAISTATATLQTVSQNASTALSNSENASNSAEEANTIATNALSKATQNSSNIDSLKSYLNFSNFDKIHTNNISNGSLNQTGFEDNITVAYNFNKSLIKFYGTIVINNTQQQQQVKITFNSNLNPSENITISNVGIMYSSNSTLNNTSALDAVIRTDGTIEIIAWAFSGGTQRLIIFPCIYFLKNFGDTLAPQYS